MKHTALLFLLLITAGAAEAQEPAGQTPPKSRVSLSDGQVLVGEVTRSSDLEIVLRLGDGAELTIPRTVIKEIAAAEPSTPIAPPAPIEEWPPDANRTRYLYSPSAMMLRAGELTFSQKELLFSTLGIGVTDFISVQIGSVFPAWFLGPQAFNLIGAVKVGAEVLPLLHLAAGAQMGMLPFMYPSPLAGGFVFVTGTYGTPDAHFSIATGVPAIFGASSYTSQVGSALFTLSGNYRVARSIAIVSENWFIPDFSRATFVLLPSFALRFIGGHLAADVGLIMPLSERGFVTSGIPIPWVDFTYNF